MFAELDSVFERCLHGCLAESEREVGIVGLLGYLLIHKMNLLIVLILSLKIRLKISSKETRM